MVAGSRETSPCRFAAAAVLEERERNSNSDEPKLVDLSPRQQISRGQELLRLLWEPVTATAATPPSFGALSTTPAEMHMPSEQVQDGLLNGPVAHDRELAWSFEGQTPELSPHKQVACGQELLRLLRDSVTSQPIAPCSASSLFKSPPNNVHIQRTASPNKIPRTPVNAVMADSRLWPRAPDRNAVSLSTIWDPQRCYTSQESFSANCHRGHTAPDRYVIELSSCLDQRRLQMNQDASPEFSDASTGTPKEDDGLEEISNYDMVEDDSRFLYRGLGRVCSPPLTPAPYFN